MLLRSTNRLCIPASSRSCLKPNSIYFAGHGIGIYNLEDAAFHHFHVPTSFQDGDWVSSTIQYLVSSQRLNDKSICNFSQMMMFKCLLLFCHLYQQLVMRSYLSLFVFCFYNICFCYDRVKSPLIRMNTFEPKHPRLGTLCFVFNKVTLCTSDCNVGSHKCHNKPILRIDMSLHTFSI